MPLRWRRHADAALGAITVLSLPPWGWWPLAPISIGGFVHLYQADGRRQRLGLAWSYWMGAYAIGMLWMVDLTIPGWIVATPIEALIMALPFVALPSSGPWRHAGVPGALVVGEATRWVIPFGGVPMTNLALGQVDAPWVGVVRVAGPLLLVAVIGALAVVVAGLLGRRQRASTVYGSIVVALVVLAALAPSGSDDESIDVAVVQAGGELGTNAVNSDEAAVFDRHVMAMEAEPPDVDLIVWSESSAVSDGPVDDSVRMQQLRELADTYDATIIANFSERDDDHFRNAAVAVAPSEGLVGRYDKVHLVPFGEYVPLRGFIENFADLSLIPREAIAGEGDAVLDTPFGPVATVISFEVYFPARVRSGVQAGGRIVTNPTLASSYTTTMVPSQSLASARLRAIESGRWVLQSSTTGFTAIVDPDGRVVARSGLREARVLSATAQLRSGQTWATRLGKWPVTALGLLLVGAAAAARREDERDEALVTATPRASG
ncbi:MAG: apolipoprotein N-acyltransferase [Actinomycetota bacterium]|nr:apolipoprotein N-acyltransferase [Actinomycetota bacterium]